MLIINSRIQNNYIWSLNGQSMDALSFPEIWKDALYLSAGARKYAISSFFLKYHSQSWQLWVATRLVPGEENERRRPEIWWLFSQESSSFSNTQSCCRPSVSIHSYLSEKLPPSVTCFANFWFSRPTCHPFSRNNGSWKGDPLKWSEMEVICVQYGKFPTDAQLQNVDIDADDWIEQVAWFDLIFRRNDGTYGRLIYHPMCTYHDYNCGAIYTGPTFRNVFQQADLTIPYFRAGIADL